MQPQHHIVLGFVYALVLYLSFDAITLFAATIIWVSSWLVIDLDHAIRYTFITGDFSPQRFWQWSKEQGARWDAIPHSRRGEYQLPVFFFHGVEVMMLLLVFSYYHIIFLYVFLGFIFHHMCDYVDLYQHRGNLFMKVSLVYVLIYNSRRDQHTL